MIGSRAIVWLVLGLAACSESYPAPGTCSVTSRRSCTCDDGGPGFETCYDAQPAIWGACVCDAAPSANAGDDRVVPYGVTVTLDGQASMDPDGPAVQFDWTVVSVPAGSTATLDQPHLDDPSFLPDVPGDYVFSLVLSDTLKQSAPAMVTITAVNDAPVAVAKQDANVLTGTLVTLDGTASSDANNDSLTYEWTVTARPPGSTAQPPAPTSATTSFTSDLEGSYTLSLVVSDGRTTSAPSQVAIRSFHHITSLPFTPIAAEYSRQLDRVVMIGQSPDALYIYDPTTDAITTVPMAVTPTSLSLSQDGYRAVIGHINSITTVNVQLARVVSHFVTHIEAHDVVDGGNGYVYVLPGQTGANGDPSYRVVNLSNGATTVADRSIFFDMRGRMKPSSTAMYTFDTTNGSWVEDWTITSGGATLAALWPYSSNGQHNACGGFWFSSDGAQMYNGCGEIFATSTTPANDMVYVAPLTGSIAWLSASTSKLLVTPGPSGDESLYLYDYPSLALDHSIPLTSFLAGGNAYPAHGRWAFQRADGVHYVAIVQADPSAGLTNDYGTVVDGL